MEHSTNQYTQEQITAIKRKYEQSADGANSFESFIARTTGPHSLMDNVVGLQWCGMWLGIETDGYTHS